MSRLLKLKHRYGLESKHCNLKNNAFDPDSGLVYTELIYRGGPMRADWSWKSVGSSRKVARFRSCGPGCTSLENMAIRCVLLNLLSLTPEILETLPWQLGKKLWNTILAQELDSLYSWTVFAEAFPHQLQESFCRRQHIVANPDMSLADYINPITSPSFAWMTFLSLSNITCSRADLINISKLSNLGALTIGKCVHLMDAPFDDNVIRAWSRAASETSAFSALRVLAMRSQRFVSRRIFNYIVDFPALAFFSSDDCAIGPGEVKFAQDLGWKYRTGKSLDEFLISGGLKDYSWFSFVHTGFHRGGVFSVKDITADGVGVIDSLPILHFELGGSLPDAALNVETETRMRCFERITLPIPKLGIRSPSIKRPLSEMIQTDQQPEKRRVIKQSRQQLFSSVLSEFAT